MKKHQNPPPLKTRPLTEAERQALADAMDKNIASYLIMAIVLMPVFLTGLAILAARKKEIEKRNSVLSDKDVPVHIVEGKLIIRSGYLFANNSVNYRYLDYCYVGDYLLPQVLVRNQVLSLKDKAGKNVTAEYVPYVSKNLRCYDASGHGYDFLADKSY
jgi:hypothetical protein